MKCKCGYRFAFTSSLKEREFETFAVIRSKNYRKVLALETRIGRSPNGEKRLSLLAKASRYVDSLIECPRCSRLLFVRNGVDGEAGTTCYRKEAATKQQIRAPYGLRQGRPSEGGGG